MKPITAAVKKILEQASLSVIRNQTYQRLVRNEQRYQRTEQFLNFLLAVKPAYQQTAIEHFRDSQSQFFQDIVASLLTPNPGYFVEFGATDGVTISNTWLLEKKLGWKGALAEPARSWHAVLRSNRNVFISTDCVWQESGVAIQFSETEDPSLSGIASTHAKPVNHPQALHASYRVKTVSLSDLLRQADAPSAIDFLSIDTEGSEYSILSALSFAERSFHLIAVEHNHRPDRDDLAQLLTDHGYIRILESLSGVDDWYVDSATYARATGVFHLG